MTLLGDDDDVDCGEFHHNASLDVCAFVKSTSSCDIDEGFINYTQVLYCTFSSLPVWLGCVLLIIWWLFMFSGLAVTADDFFCPSLAVISRSLKLSHNVAGVTFLAFGNGAPDVFSAVAAIGNAKAGDAGLAIGALFGAGVFVTAVVAGSIAIICPFNCMERPLMRDVIFYLVATYWSWFVMWDKKITQLEAAGFLVLYAVYVAVVIIGRYINQRLKKGDKKALQNAKPEKPAKADSEKELREPLLSGSSDALNYGGSGSNDNGNSVIPATYNSSTSNATAPAGGESIMSNLLTSSSDSSVASDFYTMSSPGDRGNLNTRSPNLQVEMAAVNRHQRHHQLSVAEEGLSHLKLFLEGVNPIDTEGWSEMALHWKVYEVFKCPLVLCLKLTVPVVDDEEEEKKETDKEDSLEKMDEIKDAKEGDELRNWNRPLNCFHIFLGPLFASFVTGVGANTIGGTFPVYGLVMIVAAALAVAAFIKSETDERPMFHTAMAYLGFLVAVVWIYCIANEIVNILQALGIVFAVSDAILGLTVLAWGNSIGDLIADMSMARQGYPRMGISACFGGPLFNMLIGLGIPFTIACAKYGGTFHLKVNLEEMVLAAGLGLSLVSTLIIVPLSGFRMSRPYGIFLLILYVIFLLVAVLTEVNVIKNVEL